MRVSDALDIPGMLAVRDKTVEPVTDADGNLLYYCHRLTIEWREFPDLHCYPEESHMAATPPVFSTSAPLPPLMAANGLAWLDIRDYAVHAIKVLQTEGNTAIDAIDTAFTMARAVTNRDFTGIFEALHREQADVQEIINAIKAEFGIQ